MSEELDDADGETLRKLGIESLRTYDDALAQRLGMPHIDGVIVENVRSRSVAAARGIRPRTVITHVFKQPVTTVSELVDALDEHDLTQRAVRLRVMLLNPATDEFVPRFVLLELPAE